jgi:NAD/NADP transhydrogenase alpha subunit
MNFTILIPKETRANEQRVALIPKDVQTLVNRGHKVFVEHNAGIGAGFSDQDYQNAGAAIRSLHDNDYKNLFGNINLIVRVKRPERSREIIENKIISPDTIMIGALDPLEKNSSHVDEYHKASIIAYSIDQLNLSSEDPMNLLAAMSKIAGRLALLDAVQRFHSTVKKVVIIGFGTAGRAAFDESLEMQFSTIVVLTNANDSNEIKKLGGKTLILKKENDIKQQQEKIKNVLLDADVVIASARRANQPAPLLIPATTLFCMQSGAVIVDMALSEGGNVEGAEHDETRVLGNNIIVTNTSGYPKAVPGEASKLWSTASLRFILLLKGGKNIPLAPC